MLATTVVAADAAGAAEMVDAVNVTSAAHIIAMTRTIREGSRAIIEVDSFQRSQTTPARSTPCPTISRNSDRRLRSDADNRCNCLWRGGNCARGEVRPGRREPGSPTP